MILYLGNKLSNHGFTPSSVETLGVRLQDLGLKVITKSSRLNKLFRLGDMLWNIIRYRKKNPIILIDTYSTSAFWYAWCCAYVCRILNLKYILILRGGNLPQRLDQSTRASSLLFRKSNRNIAASDFLATEFKNRGLPVQTIHNYIDIPNYPVKIRSNIKPRLLWVRSFHKIYNPKMAIFVYRKLKDIYPEATLCMVGPDKDGSLAECKQLAIELNLSVNFTGKLSKTQWIDLSAEYDIFINTTNIDNTPVSVMEAMALGMPVVTTNVGGIPFLFKNHKEGLMVNKNSVPEMTSAILSLLNDPDNTKSISAAARKKAQEWDWEMIGPQWLSLITEVTKQTD